MHYWLPLINVFIGRAYLGAILIAPSSRHLWSRRYSNEAAGDYARPGRAFWTHPSRIMSDSPGILVNESARKLKPLN